MRKINVSKLTWIYDIAGVSFIFGGMIRNWKYDDRVSEYFVVVEDKASEKHAELDRQRETTEHDVSCQEGMSGITFRVYICTCMHKQV